VVTLVARNANEVMVARMVGLAESAFGDSLESGVRRSLLCRCIWQERGFSSREDVITFNIV
jgi:hypothetical protein